MVLKSIDYEVDRVQLNPSGENCWISRNNSRCETRRSFVPQENGGPILVAVWIEVCTRNMNLSFLAQIRKAPVAVLYRFLVGFKMRVVLETLCMFLSDEGFGLRSTNRTPDWGQLEEVLTHVDYALVWKMDGKTMGQAHGCCGSVVSL